MFGRRRGYLSANAIDLPWSNGQAEGQINRLKTIKRAIYGRAGSELLRARMIPIKMAELHTKSGRPQSDGIFFFGKRMDHGLAD